MAEPAFQFDVSLSHRAKDKAVVRPLAKVEGRMQSAEVEIQPSPFSLQPFPRAFGSDWAQWEAGTFRFRDPMNRERRFLPLRLDDAPQNGF